MSPAKTAKAIEMPFAWRTRVGPGKHLLHIADRFEANTVLCLFNTVQLIIVLMRIFSVETLHGQDVDCTPAAESVPCNCHSDGVITV